MPRQTMILTAAKLARVVADCRSADPNTRVGACVYNRATGDFHLGYNGFPAGFPEHEELWHSRTPREIKDFKLTLTKYDLVVHAEANAIRKATACSGNRLLEDCILVVTNYPCHRCMVDFIIPSGIREVYYLDMYPPDSLTDMLWVQYKFSGGLTSEAL